jgi:hypothetical protein
MRDTWIRIRATEGTLALLIIPGNFADGRLLRGLNASELNAFLDVMLLDLMLLDLMLLDLMLLDLMLLDLLLKMCF